MEELGQLVRGVGMKARSRGMFVFRSYPNSRGIARTKCTPWLFSWVCVGLSDAGGTPRAMPEFEFRFACRGTVSTSDQVGTRGDVRVPLARVEALLPAAAERPVVPHHWRGRTPARHSVRHRVDGPPALAAQILGLRGESRPTPAAAPDVGQRHPGRGAIRGANHSIPSRRQRRSAALLRHRRAAWDRRHYSYNRDRCCHRHRSRGAEDTRAADRPEAGIPAGRKRAVADSNRSEAATMPPGRDRNASSDYPVLFYWQSAGCYAHPRG